MIVHVAIVNTCEVSAESKAFHLLKKTRMIGQGVFERAMPVAGLAHEDPSAILYYLRLDDSRVVSESGDIHLTLEDCLHCFIVAVRA
jgi:hypothetical protein